MTPRERDNPDILNFSRKKAHCRRLRAQIEDVNRLLKQFDAAQKMMKQLAGGGKKNAPRGRGGIRFPF